MIITTYFITTLHPKFKVVMLTTVVVSITKFNNHYHVVISKLVSITVCCSDVHYTIFTVYDFNVYNKTIIYGTAQLQLHFSTRGHAWNHDKIVLNPVTC